LMLTRDSAAVLGEITSPSPSTLPEHRYRTMLYLTYKQPGGGELTVRTSPTGARRAEDATSHVEAVRRKKACIRDRIGRIILADRPEARNVRPILNQIAG